MSRVGQTLSPHSRLIRAIAGMATLLVEVDDVDFAVKFPFEPYTAQTEAAF